jgi:chromosome partitioning protein
MTKVISFISRKGGTGKTTNAINLATMLDSIGYKVLLVETDTNYTLNTIRKMELFKTGAKEDQLFKILASEDEIISDELEVLKKNKYDYIILDTAGKTTDNSIKKICLASDLVIVPTSLSQNDLLVTFQTIEDLKPAKELNKTLKIAVLPNRINGLTKTKSISNTLALLDATILENYVPTKNIFAQASTIIPEKEYLTVTKEIVTLLEN